MSRAFGDFVYKTSASLPPQEQQVTVFPDVHIEDRNAADQFLILACDGIWDVMTNEEAVAHVLRYRSEGAADLSKVRDA